MRPQSSQALDPAYRPDIDGLRAVAVLAVIGFHAFSPSVPGGFVGVDVFFVISGFLISRLIEDKLKLGSFSYVEFYQRRIRRLFPALAVVLLGVWGIGWFTLLPSEYAALGRHIVSGAAFWANIQTYLELGYFDALASNKPLLHLWSLGVEEQFYILFPVLFVLLWRLKAQRHWWLLAVGITSFLLNVALVKDAPSFTFYLPFTRLWEFIAGALLVSFEMPDQNVRGRNVASIIGFSAILVAIRFANSESFPGWWGLLPVLGAALIIGAGREAWINRRILASPGMVVIGLISYPLYLWHWPLLVLGRALMRDGYENEHVRATAIIAIGISFLLAWLTYRFIERPVRGNLFGPARVTAAACAALAVVAGLGMATAHSGAQFRFPKELLSLMAPIQGDSDPANEDRKGPLVVTYGDSHAGHLVPGLRQMQKERVFRLESIIWNPCPPTIEVRAGIEEFCRGIVAERHRRLAGLHPDIVVIAGWWLPMTAKRLDLISADIKFLQGIGVRRIVVVGSIPHWRDSAQAEIYSAYRKDRSRLAERSVRYEKGMAEIDQQVRDMALSLGVHFISAFDVLCTEAGCLLRLGVDAKDIVQVDRTHLSAAGSRYLVSHIAANLFGE